VKLITDEDVGLWIDQVFSELTHVRKLYTDILDVAMDDLLRMEVGYALCGLLQLWCVRLVRSWNTFGEYA
jgi:hypothetical protein